MIIYLVDYSINYLFLWPIALLSHLLSFRIIKNMYSINTLFFFNFKCIVSPSF